MKIRQTLIILVAVAALIGGATVSAQHYSDWSALVSIESIPGTSSDFNTVAYAQIEKANFTVGITEASFKRAWQTLADAPRITQIANVRVQEISINQIIIDLKVGNIDVGMIPVNEFEKHKFVGERLQWAKGWAMALSPKLLIPFFSKQQVASVTDKRKLGLAMTFTKSAKYNASPDKIASQLPELLSLLKETIPENFAMLLSNSQIRQALSEKYKQQRKTGGKIKLSNFLSQVKRLAENLQPFKMLRDADKKVNDLVISVTPNTEKGKVWDKKKLLVATLLKSRNEESSNILSAYNTEGKIVSVKQNDVDILFDLDCPDGCFLDVRNPYNDNEPVEFICRCPPTPSLPNIKLLKSRVYNTKVDLVRKQDFCVEIPDICSDDEWYLKVININISTDATVTTGDTFEHDYNSNSYDINQEGIFNWSPDRFVSFCPDQNFLPLFADRGAIFMWYEMDSTDILWWEIKEYKDEDSLTFGTTLCLSIFAEASGDGGEIDTFNLSGTSTPLRFWLRKSP